MERRNRGMNRDISMNVMVERTPPPPSARLPHIQRNRDRILGKTQTSSNNRKQGKRLGTKPRTVQPAVTCT